MADELSKIDVTKLTIKDIQALKNEAFSRLKKAVDSTIELAGHQNHNSHGDHSTT